MAHRVGRAIYLPAFLVAVTALSACDSDDIVFDQFRRGVAETELTRIVDTAEADPSIRNLTVLVDSPRVGFRWQAARANINSPGGIPMRIDSAFRVDGVTKMLTSVLILQMIEKGFLTLDTRLGDILTDNNMPAGFTLEMLHRFNGVDRGDDVTIRQLLNHSSGFRDYFVDTPTASPAALSLSQRIIGDVLGTLPSGIRDVQWGPQELLLYFIGSEMSANALFAPGADFHYADTNYLVLGVVIEEVTQDTLANNYLNFVYGDAQMPQAYLEWYEQAQVDAVSHFWEVPTDTQPVNIDFVAEAVNTSTDWGGGGIVTTAAELVGFLRTLFEGNLFADADTLESMQQTIATSQPGLRYGLGLEHRIFQLSGNTVDVYGHSGLWGVGAYYIPETGTSIVYAMNQVELDTDWLREIMEALDEARLFD